MTPETYMYPGLIKLRTFGRPRLTQEMSAVRDAGLLQQNETQDEYSDEEFFPGMGGRGRGPGGMGGGMPRIPPRGQKYRNYDQFLRSNIDNQQDEREFNSQAGHDHLPFRTYHTIVNETFTTDQYDAIGRMGRNNPKVGPIDLRMTIRPGDSTLVPMRWNNPHASEVEVNLWIFRGGGKKAPVVVPFRKPTCSGEGHQDNIIRFTVPTDFGKLGAKIPDFKGCNKDTKPMCVLQVYGHSVESRQYAFAWPIIITGHDASLTTTDEGQIQPIATDPGIDMGKLRDLCLPNTDASADIAVSVPRWAKLVSDVYTHAYLNSDYSPYSGQQHESISKNMQASCVNKMWAANHGELGKSILPSATKSRLDKLETLEDRIYKRYERAANSIIKRIERAGALKNTGRLCAGKPLNIPKRQGTCQSLANGFRVAEVGATNANRLDTNTFIPSFQLPPNAVNAVKRTVFPMFRNVIQNNGQVQIYLQTLKDLLPHLLPSQPYGIIYQTAITKTTLTTKADATRFIKKNKAGQNDGGKYAATMRYAEFAESLGCPRDCLMCNPKRCKNSWDNCGQPLISQAQATCTTDRCSQCKKLFGIYEGQAATPKPEVSKLSAAIAEGKGVPDIPGEPTLPPNDNGYGSPTPPPADVSNMKPALPHGAMSLTEEEDLTKIFSDSPMMTEDMIEKEVKRADTNCGNKKKGLKLEQKSKKTGASHRRRRRAA